MTTLRQPLPYYPDTAGVYLLSDALGNVLYVGYSKQLCRRVSHLSAMQADKTNAAGLTHIKARLVRQHQEEKGPMFVEFTECRDFMRLKDKLIKEHNPPWNKNDKDNVSR